MPLPAIPEIAALIVSFVERVEAGRTSGRAAAE
jgi:hypothetical protein